MTVSEYYVEVSAPRHERRVAAESPAQAAETVVEVGGQIGAVVKVWKLDAPVWIGNVGLTGFQANG